jgi:hypothetical protein
MARRGLTGLTGLLGVVCLLATACSGDGADDDADAEAERGAEAEGDRADYVAALTESYDNPYTTAEDRRCMAEATVDVIGVEALAAVGTAAELREAGRLQVFGVTPDEATAGELVDALDACVDAHTVLFGDEEALGPEVRSCLETAVPDDLLRAFMISTYGTATGLSDDPALEAELTAGRNSCRPAATTTTSSPA